MPSEPGSDDAIKAAAEAARAHLRAQIQRARESVADVVGPESDEGTPEVDETPGAEALRAEFTEALEGVRREMSEKIAALEREIARRDELAGEVARREAKKQLRRTRRGDRDVRLLDELSADVRAIQDRLDES